MGVGKKQQMDLKIRLQGGVGVNLTLQGGKGQDTIYQAQNSILIKL